MIGPCANLVRNEKAATAAEFGLVLPVLLLFLLGIIDVGRFMWVLNQAEKATQMGVRYAVVSDPVADVLNADFVESFGLVGGDPVPVGTFNNAECSSETCTVEGSATSGHDSIAFTYIVEWMQKFYPAIQANNVWVTYQNVGLGYAGDPVGPDVAALTTVELRGLGFQPLILFGGTVNLPDIRASLPLEDAECSITGDCGSSN